MLSKNQKHASWTKKNASWIPKNHIDKIQSFDFIKIIFILIFTDQKKKKILRKKDKTSPLSSDCNFCDAISEWHMTLFLIINKNCIPWRDVYNTNYQKAYC